MGDDLTDITVELTRDRAYFREFHREWVATVGRGWRGRRRQIMGLGALAVAAAAASSLLGIPRLGHVAGVLLVLAMALQLWAMLGRASWIAMAMRRTAHRRQVRLEFGPHAVFMPGVTAGQPREYREGVIRTTPHGYLVRLLLDDEPHSIYVPHRSLRPQCTREAFLERVG